MLGPNGDVNPPEGLRGNGATVRVSADLPCQLQVFVVLWSFVVLVWDVLTVLGGNVRCVVRCGINAGIGYLIAAGGYTRRESYWGMDCEVERCF